MLPTTILYRGETKTVQFTLKSNGLPIAFADLAEVTIIACINRVPQKTYTKTGNGVAAVAGTGNENKCTITLDKEDTKYYPLGTLGFEFNFPAGSEWEIENPAVFSVKDSNISRL